MNDGTATEVYLVWHSARFASVYDRAGDYAFAATAEEIRQWTEDGALVEIKAAA